MRVSRLHRAVLLSALAPLLATAPLLPAGAAPPSRVASAPGLGGPASGAPAPGLAPSPGAPAPGPGPDAPAPGPGAQVPNARSGVPVFQRSRYTPAVLRLGFSPARAGRSESVLDLTLVPARGEVVGRRVEIDSQRFTDLLRTLYAQLARQEPMDVASPAAPARQLHRILLGPVVPDLERLGVTTLLLSADPGLQAIPFAALHDGTTYLGERYALSLTPSLGLMPLDLPAKREQRRQLAFGASRFDGLAPLPLVPQELERVERQGRGERFLDGAFTPGALIQRAGDSGVERVHVATHAEFLPGGPAKARLYTGRGPLSLQEFAALRQRRGAQPLELFALSACRTALGDSDSELGFAGLALQAGARSAIGTLWYVDDVATSSFFVQFYRYLDRGLPKAEALQATRIAMASGLVRLQGDRVLGSGGEALLIGLTQAQQLRVAGGMKHPFFWAGIVLLGTPW